MAKLPQSQIIDGLPAILLPLLTILLAANARKYGSKITLMILLICITTSAVYAQSKWFNIPPIWPLSGYFALICSAFARSQLNLLPQFPDAALYQQLGWQTVQALEATNLGMLPDYRSLRIRAYSYFVAAIYYMFGKNTMAIIVIHACAYGLTVGYWISIRDKIFKTESYWFVGIAFSIYPSASFYFSSTLREPLALLFMTIVVVRVISWFHNKKITDVVGIVISSAVVSLIRPELIPPLCIGFAAAIFYFDRSEINIRSIGILLSTVVVIVVFLDIFDVYTPRYLNPLYFFNLDILEAKRNAAATRPNAYLTWMEYTSWASVVIYLPLRITYLFISPFPWHSSIFDQTVATIDSIYLSFIIVCIIWKFKSWIRLQQDLVFLLVFAMTMIAGYSLVVSTPSAIRRRIFVVPLLIILASYLHNIKISV